MEFRFDAENGVIIDEATGERCIVLAKPRLEQIFSRLTEVFQSGAQVIINEACKSAGKWYVNEIPEETRKDKTKFLKTAVQRFTACGLGKVEIVDFKPEKNELTFRIWNNIFAEMPNDESTYCNVVEAYVSGMFEQLILKPAKTRKTKCIGKGDPYCEWHIKPAATGETV
jgi:predicted hydrocarbon binding protein